MTGKISTQCSLSGPISGELTVEASAVPIQAIDIQLFRVESILLGEKIVTETSLIQTTQASDAGFVLYWSMSFQNKLSIIFLFSR